MTERDLNDVIQGGLTVAQRVAICFAAGAVLVLSADARGFSAFGKEGQNSRSTCC